MSKPVVLSYGLGVDSTVILHRWLTDPSSRDFDLADLTVVTAQVGNEFERSRQLIEDHLLPLMRQHRVRWVQICRKSESDTDGIAVLDDSRSTRKVFIRGQEGKDVSLGAELLRAGTLQPASGVHRCMLLWKGWVIDRWLLGEFGSRPFLHAFGYNADEADTRVWKIVSKEDNEQISKEGRQLNRELWFPLLEWTNAPAPRAEPKKFKDRPASWKPHRGGWGREAVEVYARETILGGRADWAKSCCIFCPYTNGKPWAIEQLLNEPGMLARALVMEHSALGLNPRMTMYAGKSLLSVISDRSHEGDDRALEALTQYQLALSKAPWAVWRVRRVHYGPGNAKRCLERIFKGAQGELEPGSGTFTRAQAEALLVNVVAPAAGKRPVFENLHHRVWYERRREGDNVRYPFTESMDVAALAIAGEKAEKGFEKRWDAVYRGEVCTTEVPRHDASDPTTFYEARPDLDDEEAA